VNKKENVHGGKIASYINQWIEITSDKYILDIVRGYSIEFVDIPHQQKIPKPLQFSNSEIIMANECIETFLEKKIIEVSKNDSSEFISNIFFRPKKNGKVRLIINLKKLHNDVEYHHFKMETLKSALALIKKDAWFGSIDLTDAYYSVRISPLDRKYLKFIWNGIKYQFTCLSNGLSSAPRVFTKILKPVYSVLRKNGHVNVAYIDDSLLISETYDCLHNISDTCKLVDSLGFTVHLEKSVFIPTQSITFVGFIIDSRLMTVKLTEEKMSQIVENCEAMLNKCEVTIREFVQLIGRMVASEPGVKFGPLYYKPLETVKDQALQISKGNFDEKFIVKSDFVMEAAMLIYLYQTKLCIT